MFNDSMLISSLHHRSVCENLLYSICCMGIYYIICCFISGRNINYCVCSIYLYRQCHNKGDKVVKDILESSPISELEIRCSDLQVEEKVSEALDNVIGHNMTTKEPELQLEKIKGDISEFLEIHELDPISTIEELDGCITLGSEYSKVYRDLLIYIFEVV